jgi:pseudouridine-5'-phosphate glycosidase
MHAKWSLGLAGGIVVANPIPGRFELPRERVEDAIERALADARAQGVSGKAVTPFLLGRVNASTGGDSLEANVALVRNNAAVAAQIARAYAAL